MSLSEVTRLRYRLLLVLGLGLVTTTAAASPPPPITVFGTRTIVFDPEPNNAHIIDVDAMNVRDCFLDARRGGVCVLRWDDEPAETARIDITNGALRQVSRRRFEILERVLDSAEDALDLDAPSPPALAGE